MSLAIEDVLTDDKFFPSVTSLTLTDQELPVVSGYQSEQVEFEFSPEVVNTEPTYVLRPDIDTVEYTRLLAEYVLSLDHTQLDTETEQLFVHHARRLFKIVAENFVVGDTDELTEDRQWRSLFCHEARKPLSSIGLQLDLARRLPEQRLTRYAQIETSIKDFIQTLDFEDQFERLGSLLTVETTPGDVTEIVTRVQQRFYAEHVTSKDPVDFPIGIYSTGCEIAHVNVHGLELIIGELLHNSYKYGNPHGEGIAIFIDSTLDAARSNVWCIYE